jgi:AraC-like DNA-binding protein
MLLFFLSILGIFLSVILIVFNAKAYKSSLYLGFFFLLISLYGLHEYVLLFSKSVFLIDLFYLYFVFLYYLIGPMLYWYVRSVLTDSYKLKKRDIWHLLPMVIYLSASVPEMFTSWTVRTGIAREIILDATYLQHYKATFLSEIFPVEAIYLSRLLLISAYTVWSAGIFTSYLIKERRSGVLSRQYFMTRWIFVLLGFTFLLIVSQCLLTVKTFASENFNLLYTLNVLQVISGAGLIGLLISPFFFPAILYGLPRFTFSEPAQKLKEVEVQWSGEEVKKLNYGYENDYLHLIGQLMESAISNHKPYLRNGFNMTQLSVMINVPEHHLAYYFRVEKKQSFVDYRNEWRVNHAKNLITKGMAADLTLEAIGQQSGFSNRNTFLSAFKKIEGISPSEFANLSKKNNQISGSGIVAQYS